MSLFHKYLAIFFAVKNVLSNRNNFSWNNANVYSSTWQAINMPRRHYQSFIYHSCNSYHRFDILHLWICLEQESAAICEIATLYRSSWTVLSVIKSRFFSYFACKKCNTDSFRKKKFFWEWIFLEALWVHFRKLDKFVPINLSNSIETEIQHF